MRYPAIYIAVFLLGGCTLIDLDSLVPATAISETTNGLPYGIRACSPPGSSKALNLAAKQASRLQQINAQIDTAGTTLPPELAQDAVVKSILQHVRFVSTNSIVQSRALLMGQLTPEDMHALASAPRPQSVTPSDLLAFAHTVAQQVLRHTVSASNNDTQNLQQQAFWVRLKAYYTAYFQGKFVDYFSNSLAKPAASLTIGDAEIATAAGVFLEALFDEILQPTIWQDGDGKYYPGGVASKTNPPTYLTLNGVKAVPIPFAITGCGMNVPKANTLDYLAQTFATAASAETSLSVKTVGGLEIGLGVLGKLNIGDNNTLTTLLQSMVPEIVKRLTVAIGAPILEAIDVEPNQPPAQTSIGTRTVRASLSAKGRTQLSNAELTRRFSAPFVAHTGQ